MELSLKQAAKIFGVSEVEVIRWIHEENLPAALVADQYRFHRAELLEWAAVHHRPFKPSIYVKGNGDLTHAATHLADALKRGGLLRDVSGGDSRDLLRNALAGLPIPESLGVETLIDLMLQHDDLGCVAVGYGIAIPHPRRPMVLDVPEAHVRLCYLAAPLDTTGPDGRRVDKLFVMLCPSTHEHLQLLARLGAVLQVPAVRQALEDKLDLEPLCELLQEAGRAFEEEALADE